MLNSMFVQFNLAVDYYIASLTRYVFMRDEMNMVTIKETHVYSD